MTLTVEAVPSQAWVVSYPPYGVHVIAVHDILNNLEEFASALHTAARIFQKFEDPDVDVRWTAQSRLVELMKTNSQMAILVVLTLRYPSLHLFDIAQPEEVRFQLATALKEFDEWLVTKLKGDLDTWRNFRSRFEGGDPDQRVRVFLLDQEFEGTFAMVRDQIDEHIKTLETRLERKDVLFRLGFLE